MKLVVDSGSTKTKWGVVSGTFSKVFETSGINLHYLDDEAVLLNLREAKGQLDESIESIFFYGSGISSEEKVGRMTNLLKEGIALNAEIRVMSDFMGACHALFGSKSGIACILGTGASTGRYNGEKIIQTIPSLGFWIGDEGSGADLGKRLVKAYLRNELPDFLKYDFEIDFGSFDRQFVFEKLSSGKKPNAFFASFSHFLKKHEKNEFVISLLETAFEEFVKHHLLKYDVSPNEQIGFVGSVAFHFQDTLKRVMAMYFDNELLFIKDPIQALMDFHVTNVQ